MPPVCVCCPAGVRSGKLCLKATQGVHQAEEKAAAAKNSKCKSHSHARKHGLKHCFVADSKNTCTPVPVSPNKFDLCLLLLWDAVYPGTDNINTLQLAVTLHKDDFSSARFYCER